MDDGKEINEAEASQDENAISDKPSEIEETMTFVADETALVEDGTEEEPEGDESEESEADDGENAALDLIAEVAQSVNDLSAKVEELVSIQASHGDALEKLTALNRIGLAKKVTSKPSPTKDQTVSLKDQYMAMNGSELIAFTRKNRNELQQALKVSR